ncbi:MAG: putA [Parachlamydiales bacterium]|nr:putA [Parachlamydiales bacterium]
MALIFTHADKAFEILDSVRGKPQSISERKHLSLELAALMLAEASHSMSTEEKADQERFLRLLADPVGKAFTAAMADQCFRSENNQRVADQLIYLLNQFGIPQYLPWIKRAQLQLFRLLGPSKAKHLVPLMTNSLRKEAAQFIWDGETSYLNRRIDERKAQGIRLNLIRIGETVLSEAEAQKRLEMTLQDLENPNIDYISVKISTLYSQINLTDFDGTVEKIAEPLRILYRAAIRNPYVFADGEKQSRMIALDMEDYDSLYLTAAVFRKVLEEPEFHHYCAGIALQSYLPDTLNIQKELTQWAIKRVQNGGAPIHLRIVKGAYLSLEQVKASLKNWPQAPYISKLESDANFKRMISYGSLSENARVAHLGIGTHNLFDIAYAMLLRAENQVEPYVCFEMLEGMVDPIRRIVHKLTGDLLLYCPMASKDEFLNTIAYLFRRLDENTGPENFLRHVFELKPGSETWEHQSALFAESCDEIDSTLTQPRRSQNRLLHADQPDSNLPFENEPHTDFSLPQNRRWAADIAAIWKNAAIVPIPLVIGGKEILDNQDGVRHDPSNPDQHLFRYARATHDHMEQALSCAQKHGNQWAKTSVEYRSHLLAKCAQKLRERRGELIGAMMIDSGKIISEADPEVSEAIDYAQYYRHQIERMHQMSDIRWTPKGTILVASPWNFPCAIPAGGIFAALVTGNCVLLKPSSYGVLVAWNLVNALWDAGIPKEVLQFLPCSRDNSKLILDPRIQNVIFTGSTQTARKFLQMRPTLDLAGETSSKNAIIITAMADRDQAIMHLLSSAFGHNGQKCSAATLAILEGEVYDDLRFRQTLRNAAASLNVGPAWDLSSRISPLILAPSELLIRALTTLEEGEEWLLEPRQDKDNPHLWSPGIKLGVQANSFTYQTEIFGPLLGLMRADSLSHAIELANGTPYGLTSGLMSLDDREHGYWIEHIIAGNCYINRPITGSIVRRQPFGGTKASSFGNGFKTGGPNYLSEFMNAAQAGLPQEKHPVNESVNNLTSYLEKIDLSAEQLGVWYASVSNYAYWWKRLRQNRDPNKIVGQDNFFRYVPRKNIVLRIEANSSALDALRVCAAALTVGASLEISFSRLSPQRKDIHWPDLTPLFNVHEETSDAFCKRIQTGGTDRIRLVEPASAALLAAAANCATHIIDSKPLANGRLELLNYLREVSISIDYHRYGNLGIREGEMRKPIS